MILAIDIGNTNIVIGCTDGDTCVFEERLSTDLRKTELEYAVDFRNALAMYGISRKEIEGGILASVVPQVTRTVKRATEKIIKKDVLVVGAGIKTGLDIQVDNPTQLGSDLVVAAVAAVADYPAPLLIFDFGTATTVSIVDEKKRFQGRMIYPGLQVALDSLTARAAQLGAVNLEAPENIFGKNTAEAMQSGIIYSNAAAVDGIIDRLEEALGQKTTVLATGGLAEKVIPYCRRRIIRDDGLLLRGMALIYRKNNGI
ncbi:MAG TPA: type III pantothenate kinase [Candidatus Scatomonas pullistercoris]|uniref:Type III pantothenate kinase n=1 Tax=Candidatus Scatomonas pullistercoris TaxID=2840920 RepID=A0A9D1T9A9_9FIRM|nr:type III pantothenate kinase [Candidatus Scatomonas pullistercoris]